MSSSETPDIRPWESNDSQGKLGRYDRYGNKPSSASVNTESTEYASTIPRAISSSTMRSQPPPRIDRLSLRLRSNSGLKLHTNENALSQYIDYKQDRLTRTPSFNSATCGPSINGESSPPLHKKMPWATGDLSSYQDFPQSLGNDVFQIGLKHPIIVQKFRRYCKDHGYESHLEFLIKVREYTESTDEMASVLTSISTSFITSGAIHSLKMPTIMSRTLNADVKRVAHTILPGLETVFVDSKAHVERHMATSIFPGFVKHQLIQNATTALSTTISNPSSRREFPGLGESFCMINSAGTKVSAVTESFLKITGYPLEEAVHRNCGFLQGPNTNLGLGEGREATELLLSLRKDGTPSWSLCFLYPLRNQQGQIQCWLGGQVDVSKFVKSRESLLRALGYPNETDSGYDEGSDTGSEPSRYGCAPDSKLERDPSVHSRDSSRSTFSRSNRFIQQLRKPSRLPHIPSSASSSEYVWDNAEYRPQRNQGLETQRFQPRTQQQIPISPTTYSFHIVLKCNSPQPPPIQQKPPTPTGTRKKQSLKFHVMFYSEEAADLLSIRKDITEMDIFRVLADKARSPSITKTFKSVIRERIECGRPARAEIIIDTTYTPPTRPKSSTGVGRPNTAASRAGPNGEGYAKSERKAAKSSRQERLISHWTPLKNADGNVEMVVLILTPSA